MSDSSKTAVSSDNLFKDVLKTANESTTETKKVEVAEPVEEAEVQVSEIDMLKTRAKLMGIVFSNNIGIDALRSKIKTQLEGEAAAVDEVVEDEDEPEAVEVASSIAAPVARKKSDREIMIAEQMRLVRLRITNLDPKKKDLPGEIITVGNRVLGTVKKFIPFGEATDNGYHVPYILYNQLKSRQFLNIKTRKDSRGRTIVESGMAREFALEILPPLTTKQLADLAAAQAASKGME